MGIQETYLDAIKNRRLVWRRYVPSSSTQSVSFKSDDHKKATKLPTASDCVNHTGSIYWNGFAVLQFQDFWLTVIFHETSFLTNLASANSWEPGSFASETWKLTTSNRGILPWTPWSLRIWAWALQADQQLPKNRFGAMLPGQVAGKNGWMTTWYDLVTWCWKT